MAYANVDELKRAIPSKTRQQLTDGDESLLDDALEAGASIIDEQLKVRYEVPLANPPQVIKEVNIDLAIWWLYKRRGHSKRAAKRYERAMTILKEIAEGRRYLPQPESSRVLYGTGKLRDDSPDI